MNRSGLSLICTQESSQFMFDLDNYKMHLDDRHICNLQLTANFKNGHIVNIPYVFF
jgi:hypothetical protein